MKIIAKKTFIGYKHNGKFLTYSLNVYDEYDTKTRKKMETIEKKIVKYLENRKVFEYWYCNYEPINDKIKESEAIKCKIKTS